MRAEPAAVSPVPVKYPSISRVSPLRVAVVIWSGNLGGAETWSQALADALARRSVSAGLVAISKGGPLAHDQDRAGVRRRNLGWNRGSSVLWHARALANAVSEAGSDVAVVPSAGFLCAALRLGGYGGHIVAVEHGSLLQLRRLPFAKRLIRTLDLLSGVWAVDAHVALSDFMLDELRKWRHGRAGVRIDPGVDLGRFHARPRAPGTSVVLGVAARLIPGKGIDLVLKALASVGKRDSWRLEVAGDGPCRREMERLAVAEGISDRVQFRGWMQDMPSFWQSCDLAIVPSWQIVESFGMVAAEAMACGLPVIAARNGALPHVVRDRETGFLFEPGNTESLARCLERYLDDPGLRARHGAAARSLVQARFDIDRCAGDFDRLARSLP